VRVAFGLAAVRGVPSSGHAPSPTIWERTSDAVAWSAPICSMAKRGRELRSTSRKLAQAGGVDDDTREGTSRSSSAMARLSEPHRVRRRARRHCLLCRDAPPRNSEAPAEPEAGPYEVPAQDSRGCARRGCHCPAPSEVVVDSAHIARSMRRCRRAMRRSRMRSSIGSPAGAPARIAAPATVPSLVVGVSASSASRVVRSMPIDLSVGNHGRRRPRAGSPGSLAKLRLMRPT